MLQRIQTVYLLISEILLGFLFFLPFADIVVNEKVYEFTINGISLEGKIIENGLSLAVLISFLLILHVFAIFAYKKRIRQMRVLVFAILLLLGLFGLFFFFTYYTFNEASISFKLAVVFPLIAIILDYLAIRAIGKDEALIRSLDRIR